MSQTEQILEMLKRGPVSAYEALQEAGTLRLAARILDLKQQGHTIVTETVHKNGKTFAVYHLIERKKELA